MNLRLLTCNIRFDNPADGDNAWPNRREFLAAIMSGLNPDVIATQEGRMLQLKDLETLIPDYELVDSHRSWIGERMYPSFFIKKNKFEVLASEDWWLSETPDIAGSKSFDSAFPRLFTTLKLQPVDSDQDFFFVNTHLDHIKSSTREGQVQVLAQEVKRLWKDEGHLAIMGDFNDSPDSEVRNILIREFFGIQDAWKIHNKTEETSYHSFKGSIENGARIDWILVGSRMRVISSTMIKDAQDGKYPTDHFPVFCEVTV